MNVVIYSRYSTDKQSESSIEDQVRLCRVRVEYENWNLVQTYRDEGVSGSTPVGHRIGGIQLLSDAIAKKFDVLVLESLDRLSRDLVEQETVIRRFEHRGIRILGLSDGYDSNQTGRQLVRGMRGLINEVYLEDLKKKTHRGMSGQVARGFAASSAAFGYINIKGEHGSTIEIDQEAACRVQWVFEEFAGGRSCKNIICELNEKKIKSPRGSSWGISSLYGSPAKGSGLLHNELYRGRHIWNRSQWVKDPDTGKRVRLERPESEWCINERQDLRIISEELWEKTRSRFRESRYKGGIKGKGGRVRSLLGGLMSCGKCGAPVVVVSSHSYGCTNRMNRGPAICEGINVNRIKTEERVLAEICEMLLCDELVECAYVETMRVLSELSQNDGESRNALLKKIDELDKEICRYIEAIGAVGISESLAEKLQLVEAEKLRCKKELSLESEELELPELQIIKKLYKDMAVNLQRALKNEVNEARRYLKDLLREVEITKEGNEIYGHIKTNPIASLNTTGSVDVVAGARFELTTFGL